MNRDRLMVQPGSKISLKKDFDSADTKGYKNEEAALEKLQKGRERLESIKIFFTPTPVILY